MSDSLTIAYFGKEVVEKAISDYFARNGLGENVRDELMLMAVKNEDNFFEMVSNYIMKNELA